MTVALCAPLAATWRPADSVCLWSALGLSPSVPASPHQVDQAFLALPATGPDSRYAHKALRDLAYQAVYAQFKTSTALAEAGFFNDGLWPAVEVRTCWDTAILTTPFDKLLSALEGLDPEQRVTVLLTTGAFSPVHAGHLALMSRAKDFLQAQGHLVVGGYLSPSHDDYVSTKQGGAAHMPIAHRLALCQEALADSDWLMVDPWEGRYAPTSLNFTDVLLRLERYLGRLFPRNKLTRPAERRRRT